MSELDRVKKREEHKRHLSAFNEEVAIKKKAEWDAGYAAWLREGSKTLTDEEPEEAEKDHAQLMRVFRSDGTVFQKIVLYPLFSGNEEEA
jgi:hypothetical protein